MLNLKSKIVLTVLIILTGLVYNGCTKSNPVTSDQVDVQLIYENSGVVDSLTGICSAFQIRNYFIELPQLQNCDSLRICFTAGTDGDLSNIEFFAMSNSNLIRIYNIEGLTINNVKQFDVSLPVGYMNNLQLRLKLFASVCTGQTYNLYMKDLRIYSIN